MCLCRFIYLFIYVCLYVSLFIYVCFLFFDWLIDLFILFIYLFNDARNIFINGYIDIMKYFIMRKTAALDRDWTQMDPSQVPTPLDYIMLLGTRPLHPFLSH